MSSQKKISSNSMRVIDLNKSISNISKKKIRDFLGVKSTKGLIKLAEQEGLDLGKKQITKEKRAFKYYGELYNDVVEDFNDQQAKEKKKKNEVKKQRAKKLEKVKKSIKKLEKKKLEKKKLDKNTIIIEFDSDDLVVSLNRLKHFIKGLQKTYKEGRNINVLKTRIGAGGIHTDKKIEFSYRFTNNFSKDFKEIFLSYIQIDSDTNKIDNDTDYKIYINIGKELTATKMKQYFKLGTTNCFFKPIMEWAEDKLENSKSKATTERYRAMFNKLNKDNEKYFNSGVTENDMNFLAQKYQINIEVNTPFQKAFIVVKSNKKALSTFRYINTKIDHIDHNKIVNLKCEEVSQDFINSYAENLIKQGLYFTYKKNSFGYSKISTLDGTYSVNTDYHKEIYEFEEKTGLNNCYIDDITDNELSDFVRQGTHFNETIEFKDDLFIRDDELGTELNNKYINFNHIDMSKAYSNFHLSKYYKGFLGKPTDLRKCDHIVDVGYYQIKNVNFDKANHILKAYNEKLKVYNDNVYPSPELDFLTDNGVTFDIVAGCWGAKLDFRFSQEMINSKKNYPDEPSWYARYTGSMFCNDLYSNFYVSGDEKLAEHLACYENKTDIVEFNSFTNEIQVSYKKQHNNHLSHICGFITGYMRLNVLEQLMNMEIDNILKVVVDGIYFMGETELFNCFTPEEKKSITINADSSSYISNDEFNLEIEYPEYKEHFMTELHIGVGGSGKTHKNIYDKGLLRKLYVAPSWKLSREKNRECGIDNQVWANLLSDDDEKTDYFKKRYSTLIIDEISMMSERAKIILLLKYKGLKIIFCGDPNYQLPQFQEGEEAIKLTGFKKTYTYTENRRCKCEKLLEILTLCRELIDKKNLYHIIKKLIPSISQKELIKEYTIKDLILTRSIKNRDLYTEMLIDNKKYYVLKTDRKYCKGEIIYEKPDDNYKEGVDYELRNAYTIHSIQGETAKNKLYIHDTFMEPTAIYTALSRAEYLHQINFVRQPGWYNNP